MRHELDKITAGLKRLMRKPLVIGCFVSVQHFFQALENVIERVYVTEGMFLPMMCYKIVYHSLINTQGCSWNNNSFRFSVKVFKVGQLSDSTQIIKEDKAATIYIINNQSQA